MAKWLLNCVCGGGPNKHSKTSTSDSVDRAQRQPQVQGLSAEHGSLPDTDHSFSIPAVAPKGRTSIGIPLQQSPVPDGQNVVADARHSGARLDAVGRPLIAEPTIPQASEQTGTPSSELQRVATSIQQQGGTRRANEGLSDLLERAAKDHALMVKSLDTSLQVTAPVRSASKGVKGAVSPCLAYPRYGKQAYRLMMCALATRSKLSSAFAKSDLPVKAPSHLPSRSPNH